MEFPDGYEVKLSLPGRDPEVIRIEEPVVAGQYWWHKGAWWLITGIVWFPQKVAA